MSRIPRRGSWSSPAQTQAAGTAIAVPILPFRSSDQGAPMIYKLNGSRPNWYDQPFTHVTRFSVVSLATAHTWYFLRPKNFTTIAEAVTANDTTIVMTDDPGLVANYKYPLPSGITTHRGAANTPAGNDYCAFQLDDGTWHFSLISSLATLTLTIATGTPNNAGAVASVGNVLFFFAAGADLDPATGLIDPTFQPNVSAATLFADDDGLVTTLHPGDPMLLVNANASNASIVSQLSGYYGKY